MIAPADWIASRRDISPNTRRAYTTRLNRAIKHLAEWSSWNEGDSVDSISVSDLWDWLDTMEERGHSLDHRRGEWCVLRQWLSINGCDAVATIRPVWPSEMKNREWLDSKQALECWNAATLLGPDHRLIISLELWGMARRIEVQRLNVSDALLPNDRIRLKGKGRGGPKIRIIARSRHLTDEINRFMKERQTRIALNHARGRFIEARYEDRLFLIKNNSTLNPAGLTKLDSLVNEIHALAGTGFSGHHVFRRTGARLLWEDGIPVETISSLLGHSSINMTLEYIGVSTTHQAESIEDFGPDKIRGNANE